MGGVLASPVELTLVQRQGSQAYRSAAAEMQGYRSGHEDAHAMACGEKTGVFWVLDGHGGDKAAHIGAPRLKSEFVDLMNKTGALPDDDSINKIMVDVDYLIRETFKKNPDQESGATVVGCLSLKNADGSYNLKLVNCGDSRAIVFYGPGKESSAKVSLRTPEHLVALKEDPNAVAKECAAKDLEFPLIQETIDHKPSHPTEKARIEACGGHVTEDEPPRLDGNLAVSRGLGDFEYKASADKEPGEQKVSCVPDIYYVDNVPAGSCVALCCDGVWDVCTASDVAELVRDGLEKQDPDLGDIAASIVRTSLDRNSRDNVTAMVIQLGSGMDWAESQPMDEMKHFEKLLKPADDPGAPDEDVKKQYISFLENHGFRREPCQCEACARWFSSMMQCPCKKVNYCNKSCQKKGWKKHKSECAAVSSSPGAAKTKKK